MMIRPLSLGLLRSKNGKILLHCAVDSHTNDTFYRPLGGGIEFSEHSKETIQREFLEEINVAVKVGNLVKVFENVFESEGTPGDEIVFLYEIEFENSDDEREEYEINENGKIVGKAVWRCLSQITEEGNKVYPEGIENYI